jgi:hypothetical protein
MAEVLTRGAVTGGVGRTWPGEDWEAGSRRSTWTLWLPLMRSVVADIGAQWRSPESLQRSGRLSQERSGGDEAFCRAVGRAGSDMGGDDGEALAGP